MHILNKKLLEFNNYKCLNVFNFLTAQNVILLLFEKWF